MSAWSARPREAPSVKRVSRRSAFSSTLRPMLRETIRTWLARHNSATSSTVVAEFSSRPSVKSRMTPPSGRSRAAVNRASLSRVKFPAGVSSARAPSTASLDPEGSTIHRGESSNAISPTGVPAGKTARMAPILDVVDLSSEGERERLVSTATTTGTSAAQVAGPRAETTRMATGIKAARRQ